NRPPPQRRIVALLDGGIERIHVDMEDASHLAARSRTADFGLRSDCGFELALAIGDSCGFLTDAGRFRIRADWKLTLVGLPDWIADGNPQSAIRIPQSDRLPVRFGLEPILRHPDLADRGAHRLHEARRRLDPLLAG